MDLEAQGIEAGHVIPEQDGIDEADSVVDRRPPKAVEVWLEQRRAVVLDDAVQHHLDRRRPEAAERAGAPPLDELLDLFRASLAIPPVAGDRPAGQPPALGEEAIGGEVSGGHPGVLPGTDPEALEVGLGEREPAHEVLGRRGRKAAADHLQRPLVERPARLPVRIPLDPSVGRIDGIPVDRGDLEGPTVHPGPVPIAVDEEGGAIRDHPVERLAGRRAAGECRHRPAVADQPGAISLRLGVGLDGLEVGGRVDGQVVERAAGQTDPGHHRVDVRILEGRQQGSSGQLDPARPRAHLAFDIGTAADRHDSTGADGYRFGRLAGRVPLRVHRQHAPAGQDQVGRSLERSHRRDPPGLGISGASTSTRTRSRRRSACS